ncbi:MAG: hypothetical protein PVSMB1_18840 [Gemmatimonadaceae bacterium]
MLHHICILILIDKYLSVHPPAALTDLRILPQQECREPEQVIEVERAHGAKPVIVSSNGG